MLSIKSRISAISKICSFRVGLAIILAAFMTAQATVAQASNWSFQDINNNNSSFVGINGDSVYGCRGGYINNGGIGVNQLELYFILGPALEVVDNQKYSLGPELNHVACTLSNSGKAHIVYDTLQGLKYATNESGNWVIQTITTTPSKNISSTSIAISANGKLHVGYTMSSDQNLLSALKYATKVQGQWKVTLVDISPFAGTTGAVSIAVGNNNAAHIAYATQDGPVAKLKYASNSTGNWVAQVVRFESSNVNNTVTINFTAIDLGNTEPFIAYTSSQFGLKYATHVSGNWIAQNVDVGGNISAAITAVIVPLYDIINDTADAADTYSPSIAVNAASGKSHISYYLNGDLKYATNTSGSWVKQMVDFEAVSFGEWGSTSIELNSAGKPKIAYSDDTNTKIRLATKN